MQVGGATCRYVQMVVNTGAHFRLRWQEQAVEAMVWQVGSMTGWPE